MCGIAIIGSHRDNRKKIKKALSEIKHRGNHPYEYEVFKGAALGANRLAIVDEESGRQPKANEEKTIYATQNGEIFNHVKLAKRLRSLGHIIKTENDTEILPHLWEEYKEKMVH
ncbi:MAG: Asparagine synthetase [Candidatus Moranbacteria bacterium GW2011_GWC1_45_18]|nr:MAG: Asparagine synthetase [Candidatus Moranbacteria bacterium GW2011_GWC2_40_12]KKT33485.1 MAG: Asparagine synthetase [Candidatus Moranbacteria bacterium GW2011_GWF2_44_10]KKT72206.1 MAG: Asparagine synthetase [Candidatus Moranbacteria bacterium GW2011_GWF1_44_4]KKU00807.1 MAG: Asparagine synthetase [Candidatus Moranbacteria bacterium GW2011_GWC1_45_18]OGI24771.1 MAG: hypothetical protein A2194_04490 [Candidatus Moranbacteria bacterium RIFOXYA1_FULL_44_8]OGI35310.1 MAG: hypothetical protei